MVQTVSPEEHQRYLLVLDEWWSKLHWTTKQDVRKLLQPLQLETTSKLDYINTDKYQSKLPIDTVYFLNFRKEVEASVNKWMNRLGDPRDIHNISAILYQCNDNFDKMHEDYKKGVSVETIAKRFINGFLREVVSYGNDVGNKIKNEILNEINYVDYFDKK